MNFRHEEGPSITNLALERSSVFVILAVEPGRSFEDAFVKLQSAGLCVVSTDDQEGIIEGTIECGKAKSLKSLEFVKYVREVFNYTADFPPGDPRDLDGAEDEV